MASLQLRFAPGIVVALALGSIAAGGTVAMADGARDRATLAVDAVAVPTTSPVVIDGNFDEAVWRDAPAIGEFVQREPTEGAAPTERTEARVAYDDQAVYVAVRAFDREPAGIKGMLTRRDERSPSDWVRVVIDSYHDRRSAFEFSVNPAGVKADRYYFNDSDNDDSWDAVWDVQVARDADGWRAEFRIPFSQLRFSSAGGPVGFAVVRELPRANETSSWPLHRPQRARLRLAVRRGERPAARRLAQAARAAALHAGRGGADRRRGRRSADQAAPTRARASAST